jgi:hypothetical protein
MGDVVKNYKFFLLNATKFLKCAPGRGGKTGGGRFKYNPVFNYSGREWTTD